MLWRQPVRDLVQFLILVFVDYDPGTSSPAYEFLDREVPVNLQFLAHLGEEARGLPQRTISQADVVNDALTGGFDFHPQHEHRLSGGAYRLFSADNGDIVDAGWKRRNLLGYVAFRHICFVYLFGCWVMAVTESVRE